MGLLPSSTASDPPSSLYPTLSSNLLYATSRPPAARPLTRGLQLFEQLKNIIIARRTARNGVASALSDLDFFFLGAICKLFATGITYPCTSIHLEIRNAD
jgi:hypothetical protein